MVKQRSALSRLLCAFNFVPTGPECEARNAIAILPNRSQRGADTQAVLMSIYRTLKQRGHDPLATITNALSEYLTTGKLPALPS